MPIVFDPRLGQWTQTRFHCPRAYYLDGDFILGRSKDIAFIEPRQAWLSVTFS